MTRNRRTYRFGAWRPGFTLTELAVTAVIMIIVILALGTVIVDSIRGWHKMYARVYADVVTDSYVARNAFDRVVRSAGQRTPLLVDNGGQYDELVVYYYSSPSASTLDRYARFYVDTTDENQLKIDHGNLSPTGDRSPADRTEDRFCRNVSRCFFKKDGRSAQMELTLDDETLSATVVSSAVMHNGS